MGYAHMFYAVDLSRLRSLVGSGDLTLYEEIRQKDEAPDEDELEAIRGILLGECADDPDTVHTYGYALKRICEHIGERIGEEVAAVRDHPYRSKLVANGPPVRIPYNPADFPEMGYLEATDLAAEHRLATHTKPRAKRTLLGWVLRKISGGMVGREPSAEDIAEDMAAYAGTLQECLARNRGLVSFRH